ncbi:MAG TPA: DEAD/DEAH box helicase family protein, partial [Methanosarcina sp.]|nr:DEAD/DEAH box helicase family protein [Methanosarcina sp.]
MNKYLEKIAKRSDAQEHQQRVLDKLDKSDGVIVAHTMGSGKTLTSLLAAEKAQAQNPKEDVIAVVPASLASNMDKEIKKHGLKIDKKRFHVLTYD